MKWTIYLIQLFSLLPSRNYAQIKPFSSKQKAPNLELSIRNELDTTLEKYRNEKSTESIWKQMRKEADDILFTFFQKGKFLGVTKNQAYFIKIGPDTVTVTDIKSNKKILMAGIATQKPAEFVMIRIEK